MVDIVIFCIDKNNLSRIDKKYSRGIHNTRGNTHYTDILYLWGNMNSVIV